MIVKVNKNNYINQQVLDRMKAIECVPLIKISFDGIGYHEWMRNHTDAEETTLRAISLCIENGFPSRCKQT